ncbi:MAG TPA: VTT domain-containing protein [Myxococcales bacterium]|jgi:membrane protein DedA with SNARE-associated domain|nr:VTT domain-containing protein [Myxococcales bacterium]
MPDLILQHGHAVLFIVSLIAQLGVPLPLTPLLLAAGVLAKEGQISLSAVVAISAAASALGHLVWYEAGRRRGTAVLRLICRISLEPDSCVRRTENLFARHGGRALVAAPFVPGLGAVAPPLAGMAGMPIARFLLLDSLGAVFWSGLLAGIGFVAGPELMALVQVGLRFGAWLGLAAGAVLGLWLGWKIAQRSAVARAAVVARIEPDDLRSRLDSDDPPLVVDLRSDMTRGEESIPGARPVAPRDLPRWAEGIPRDKEIVVACD